MVRHTTLAELLLLLQPPSPNPPRKYSAILTNPPTWSSFFKDPNTGLSRGCGLVELETREEAQAAVAALNGAELKGRRLYVREDREDYLEGGAGEGTRVYVGNLAWQVQWHDLKDHMSQVGVVKFAEIAMEDAMRSGKGGKGMHMGVPIARSKGYGIVTYEHAEDAARAIAELMDTELMGRLIYCREDREADKAVGSLGTGPTYHQGLHAGSAGWSYGGKGKGGKGKGGKGKGGKGKGGKGYFQAPLPPYAPFQGIGIGSPNSGAFSAAGRQVYVGNLSPETTWKDLRLHFGDANGLERADVAMAYNKNICKGFGTVRFSSMEDAAQAIRAFNGSSLLGKVIEVREDRKAI